MEFFILGNCLKIKYVEGPGVKVIAERLSFLEGRKILDAFGNTKKVDLKLLPGSAIEKVFSHGKNLLFKIEGRGFIRVHFLMYGSFSINKLTKSEKQIRFGFKTEESSIFFYNCSVNFTNHISFKGQDIIDPQYEIEKTVNIVKDRKDTIGDLLLDQDVFPGVGNIIRVEGLFRARVHPASQVENIPLDKIYEVINKTREFALIFYEFRKKGYKLKDNLVCYGKKQCIYCGGPILRRKLGERKRVAYYCENCQKLY